MGLLSKKKKKRIEINYLDMTPSCNYEHETKDGALINVLVPKFTDGFLGKYLQPKLKYKYIKANMDEFGTAVWLLMDGRNKVGEIAAMLIDRFGEKIQPVNERLTKFLTELYNNDFISFNELKKGKENG